MKAKKFSVDASSEYTLYSLIMPAVPPSPTPHKLLTYIVFHHQSTFSRLTLYQKVINSDIYRADYENMFLEHFDVLRGMNWIIPQGGYFTLNRDKLEDLIKTTF